MKWNKCEKIDFPIAIKNIAPANKIGISIDIKPSICMINIIFEFKNFSFLIFLSNISSKIYTNTVITNKIIVKLAIITVSKNAGSIQYSK